MKNLLLITIFCALSHLVIAQTQSMELLSFPTEISKISWGPSGPIDKPIVLRFKNIKAPAEGTTRKIFFNTRLKSAVQTDIDADETPAPLSLNGVTTARAYNYGSSAAFGTASQHSKIIYDEASKDSPTAHYLNYSENTDGTINFDMIVDYVGANTTVFTVDDEYTMRIAYFGEGASLYCLPTEPDGNGGYKLAGWTYKGDPASDSNVQSPMNLASQVTYAQNNVLSFEDKIKHDNVLFYPNPTDGLLHITDVTDMQSISILNLLGQNVKTLKAANTIDVSDLNKGIYFLSTDTGLTRKFIKE